MQSVCAVVDLERGRVAGDRYAGVVDGCDQIVDVRATERGRRDHFSPAAHIAALDVVRNAAPDLLALYLKLERSTGVTRLIAGAGSGARFGAISADGERLFISTREPLVPEDTDSAQDIYELFNGELRLVSTGPTGGNGDFEVDLGGISKDGTHVFFRTRESLVSSDTDGGDSDTGRGVDVYENAHGRTVLISTSATSPNGQYAAGFDAVSDDGKRVFFTTSEPLVSEDQDCSFDYPQCRDVYERFNGVTTLISRNTVFCGDGDAPYCPSFIGISRDGRRAFFVSSARVVPEDTDDLNDLYVATVMPHACRPGKPGKKPKKCGF